MGKRKKTFREKGIISRLLFSRFVITVLALLIQVALLLAIFLWLGKYEVPVMGGLTVLSILTLIYIVNSESNPSYKLAWVMPIMLLPILGTFLYLFVQTNIGNTMPRKMLRRVLDETDAYARTKPEVKANLEETDTSFVQLAHYIEEAGGYPTYQNTEVEYYPLGEIGFEAMKTELEKAKQFIFMEYFAIEEGVFWDTILEILKRKVKEGVEVRVMYDDLGCVALLPRNYPELIEPTGIKMVAYSRLKPFLSTHYNNRDHRKITVIDGKVALSGGINLTDEYINVQIKYGHWKDNAFRVRGEAVKSYTLMFLQMWNSRPEAQEEDYAKYMEIGARRIPMPGDGFVIPYGDGPHQKEMVAEHVYMDILNHAKSYVSIMTPYLILDNEFLTTIKHTVKRGVQVSILIPHIPDKWFAFVVARSYYPELIAAGVQVFEYTPGFVHSKMYLADDEIAVVGTVNMDFRSLYLHYECASLFYRNAVIQTIKNDFEETYTKSQRVRPGDYKKIKWFDRVAGRVLRLLGPLL